MRKTIKAAGLAFFLTAGIAHADTLPAPTASYDATADADVGSTHYTAQINVAGPRARITSQVNNLDQTILVDRSTGSVMLLVPGFNTAVPLDTTGKGHFDIAELNNVPVTAEGQEIIMGLPATRYAVTGNAQQGSFSGHIWETANGIILKIDGNTVHKDKATPIVATLSNLHIRPQSPALFVLPNGIKQLPVGLVGMMKGVK